MKTFSQKQKEFLKKPILANISVIHSTSQLPIVFPAWILEYDNKLYLSTGVNSKKVNHLKINSRIGVNVVSVNNFPYLGISGTANFIDKLAGEQFTTLRDKIFEKYDPTGDFKRKMESNPDQMERLLIEITPSIIFGGVD